MNRLLVCTHLQSSGTTSVNVVCAACFMYCQHPNYNNLDSASDMHRNGMNISKMLLVSDTLRNKGGFVCDWYATHMCVYQACFCDSQCDTMCVLGLCQVCIRHVQVVVVSKCGNV